MSTQSTRRHGPSSSGDDHAYVSPGSPGPDDGQAEVYPHRFTSRHRRFRLGGGAPGVGVDVWSHNLVSWVTLTGSLAPAARRPLVRLLAAECGRDRSITINTSALDTDAGGDALTPVWLTLAALGVGVHLTDADGEPDGARGADTGIPDERL